MGFVLWAALTALTLRAGLALALRFGKTFSIGEHIVAGVIAAVAIVVGAIEALGYSNILYPWTLAVLVTVIDSGLLVYCDVGTELWSDFRKRLRGAARRTLFSPVGAIATVPAALLFFYYTAYVYLMPSWGWDALWYHDPIASYAYQEHSLWWVDTPIPFINSYPKNIELLSLWNVIFCPDDRFLDAVQLPLALVAVVAIAALCRRCGASPGVSWALALCWIFTPAVVINIPSNYNDTAVATLRLAAILFLARADATNAHRLFGTLALGVYMGSKVSGLVHAAILLAVAVLVLAWQIRGTPRWIRRVSMAVVLMAVVTVLLGGATYIRDLIRFGNPFWPAKVNIFGRELPGTWDWISFDKPPWGLPGGIQSMWRSFREPMKNPLVDVRTGGFGPLWLYWLMPLAIAALLLAVWFAIKKRSTFGVLPILAIVATAMATGAPWWARHVLALPVSGLLGAAILFSRVRWRWVGGVIAVGILAASIAQAWPMRKGFSADADLLWKLASMSPVDRSQYRIGTWTYPGVDRRDQLLGPGDAAIYDDKPKFIYQFWRNDWKNRVLYRPVTGDAKDWLASLDADSVKMATVTQGSVAEMTLKAAGWTNLGLCTGEKKAYVWVKAPPGMWK